MPRAATLLLALLLAGCVDPKFGELQDTLDEKQRLTEEPAEVEVPEMPAYTPVAYAYPKRRSPFLPPDELGQEALAETFDSELAPDQSRSAEPLESYPLPELELVGTLRMGKRRSALIKTPQGEVTSVREGSYMGVNFGRVKQIEPQRLTVVERIFKPREGWQERSVSIELAVDEARQ
ncbi:pilus assembly protein PilP [Halomonas piscis]|uniref:pilus assembly protein PilP n=1 Tax=Halomonas piscis TaxID=3031727 RepID=UPI00289847F2|nr:pilus assembly protein PilP [Halomonas piscis]